MTENEIQEDGQHATASSSQPADPIELRTAVRFPVKLPVQVRAGQGEEMAETINISANGMLFSFMRSLDKGSAIEFDLKLPAGALGMEKDVVVHCVGRVVRCYRKSESDAEIAAVIDEYQMLS